MHKEYLIDWRYYTCGANGQIYSYLKNRYLKDETIINGYVRVGLRCIDGKYRHFFWHRVIYTFFYGTIPEGMQCNHIDENKQNNTLSNLNLMTAKENSNWGTHNERISAKRIGMKFSEEHRRKLSERQINNQLKSKPVVAIDDDGNIVYEFASTREAERHGFNKGAVSACCRGKLKHHGGYRWYFKEDYLNEKESE